MYPIRDRVRHIEIKRPEDSSQRLKIQQEKDFLIAQALNLGYGSDVFIINNLPDAHFKKIIDATKIGDKKTSSKN